MNHYQVSRRARRDLQEIYNYVAQNDLRAADRLIDRIAAKYQMLADAPESGTSCDEFAPGLRFFAVGNYVIYYRLIDTGIEVVRVAHGARDVSGLFP